MAKPTAMEKYGMPKRKPGNLVLKPIGTIFLIGDRKWLF